MQIAVLDWILGAYLLAGLIKGWRKGLILELMSLGSWILAYFGARQFAPLIATYLPLKESGEAFRYAAGFATTFVLGLMALSVLASVLKKSLSTLGIGSLDSVLGAALSALRSLLILVLLTALLLYTPLQSALWWKESQASVYLVQVLRFLKPMLPELVAQKIMV